MIQEAPFKKGPTRSLRIATVALATIMTSTCFLFSPAVLQAVEKQQSTPPSGNEYSILSPPATTRANTEPSPATTHFSIPETSSKIPEQSFQTPVPSDRPVQEQQCHELAVRLHSFFSELDQKEYIQEFKLGVPAQQYFINLTNKLLSNPPVVSRESDDLYTILKNMAHFFRVIGGKNIIIIKGILDRERENIEDIAADLYLWTTGDKCRDEAFAFNAPIDKLYEYAGFFLNSMGGRSYLFRRDSRSRLLVNYYSILLINRANKEGINQHGIDIKPLLPMTTNEIEGSNQLIYKENYLDGLYELIEQYQ